MSGIKWTMHNSQHFTAEKNGFTADLKLGGFYPIWSILRNGEIIDQCQFHHPATSSGNSELAGRAQVEKILNNLTSMQ